MWHKYLLARLLFFMFLCKQHKFASHVIEISEHTTQWIFFKTSTTRQVAGPHNLCLIKNIDLWFLRDRTRKLSEKNIVYKSLLPLVTPFHHSCNWLAVRWRLQKNQDNQSFRKLIHFGLECRRVTYLLQKSDISSPNENTGVHHTKSIWKVNTFIEILPVLCVTSLALNTGNQYLPHFQRPGFPFYSRSWILRQRTLKM